ncbi:MAG: hypothetical protein RR743_06560 [Oscillospiraceae bacterium]
MAVRQNLIELCEKMAHGHYEINEDCSEYKTFEKWMTDEQIKILMAMELLTPALPASVAYDIGEPEDKVLEMLREMADIGVVQRIEKGGMELFVLLVYAPGAFEFMLVNEKFCDEHPEIPVSFEGHATKSYAKVIHNVPMGAGVMRAIPV